MFYIILGFVSKNKYLMYIILFKYITIINFSLVSMVKMLNTQLHPNRSVHYGVRILTP